MPTSFVINRSSQLNVGYSLLTDATGLTPRAKLSVGGTPVLDIPAGGGTATILQAAGPCRCCVEAPAAALESLPAGEGVLRLELVDGASQVVYARDSSVTVI